MSEDAPDNIVGNRLLCVHCKCVLEQHVNRKCLFDVTEYLEMTSMQYSNYLSDRIYALQEKKGTRLVDPKGVPK